MLRQQPANLRNERDRNLHRGMGRPAKGNFVLRDRFRVHLTLVVLEDPPNTVFVPSPRKLAPLLHRFLLLLRWRARLAFGPISYAVTTNADLGSGSGTYTTRT
jgi:hypothetical protein